ncbi:hypothetical protein P7C70_g9448, partial [Phenoliferia sp. Uapishka_3]
MATPSNFSLSPPDPVQPTNLPSTPLLDEQLLFAAKTDSSELLESIFALEESAYDVNFQDGLGNTGRSSRHWTIGG